ncbi:antibiotic biosynthesis monooxygenase family protein [Streptomyces sp. RFCAC02]|uniref:putative quinol monooxygenase n=1 Tax=Streptomyces sp. RFCAC02 TaxID=2499143 RepID=UPI00101F45F7|nr:antibiotic biosynthesis monooxygenase family protein [Streptomyces sp. RFCAC02]
MPYAVVAHYRCAPGDAPAVRDALLRMRESTLREPGNRAYVVHADAEDASGDAAFTLYEQYADRDAFEAHTRTPHFAEHIARTVRPRLTARTVWFGDVI